MDFSLPLILDGATGTQLQKRGMPAGCCSEKWILDNPDALLDLQRGYLRAGSDAVYAPTFGANRVSLKAHGQSGVADWNRRLVALSREAVGTDALVGGDMSPCGLRLPPMGDSSFDELVDVFTEQAAALEEAGVDFFGAETQMSLAEARASLIAVRSVSDKPVFISFTCGPTGRTLYGGSLVSALLALQDMGASAFGVNCVGDLDRLTVLLDELRRYAGVPLIAKPNAGLPETRGGKSVYHLTPAELAAHVPDWLNAGAYLLGGCCGTGPEHIAAIREKLPGIELSPLQAGLTGLCASEFSFACLGDESDIRELEITEDLSDNCADLLDEGADAVLLNIRDLRDVRIIEESQYAIKLPLVVRCPDGDALTRFLRVYNGKPILI